MWYKCPSNCGDHGMIQDWAEGVKIKYNSLCKKCGKRGNNLSCIIRDYSFIITKR